MGINSIKSNLTKDSVISDIRMTLAADLNKNKVIVVVEGEDDVLFLKNKVKDNVEIQESFSGKEGVKEIISGFTNERVIGVCDRDYENNSGRERIFYYDYSCLEVMLAMCDETFSAVYNEYYLGTLDFRSLRDKLFFDLKWLSVFRKCNYKFNWGVNFSGFSVSNAYDIDSGCFNICKGLKELLNHNPNLIDTNRQSLSQVSQAFRNTKNDELNNITQGHDYINYFKCFTQKTRGNSPNSKNISSGLRCAYRLSDFKKTKVYEDIYNYSNTIGISILL